MRYEKWKIFTINSTPCANVLIVLWCVFDLATKEQELDSIDQQSGESGFWDNAQAAQQMMQKAARLREEVTRWNEIAHRIADASELAQMDDDSLRADLEHEITELSEFIDELEFTTMFSGTYDREEAIVGIHAGTGGVDAMDWAAMLERMYLRWAEARRLKVEIIDRSPGDETGLKSVTMLIRGDYVYGYLRSERGVHRLVRLSPFDSAHRRHTSFALVEVWPDVADDIEIDINPGDLVIETFKAGGAGGQHVQKNETAVRITHKPSGLVVSCQNERSLTQNRENAMRVLRARLFELEQVKQADELAQLKGDYVNANFGNQIRSYVLHPYQMVKDHRTEFESTNTGAVLDGQLTGFMEAFLRQAS
jgi:peptide chain release factor 2